MAVHLKFFVAWGIQCAPFIASVTLGPVQSLALRGVTSNNAAYTRRVVSLFCNLQAFYCKLFTSYMCIHCPVWSGLGVLQG